MAPGSHEESRTELQQMTDRRVVSPRTLQLFRDMMDRMDELETIQDPDQLSKKKAAIAKQEEVLESRLEKDRAYAGLLQNFRDLTTANIILRYGDYLAHNLRGSKRRSSNLAITSGDGAEDILRDMSWKEVWAKIDEEQEAVDVYWENLGLSFPATPYLNLIKKLAPECLMNYEEALFQIEWYARRCNIAHSGIDEDIKAERWHEVAMYICRDRAAIQKRMISEGDSNLESGLLTAISIFETLYFESTWSDTKKSTGQVFYHYKLSKRIKEQKQEKKAIDLDHAVLQMSLESFEPELEKAETLSGGSQTLRGAANDLCDAKNELAKSIKALEEEEKAVKEQRKLAAEAEKRFVKAQKDRAAAEMEYKRMGAKFRGVVEEESK